METPRMSQQCPVPTTGDLANTEVETKWRICEVCQLWFSAQPGERVQGAYFRGSHKSRLWRNLRNFDFSLYF